MQRTLPPTLALLALACTTTEPTTAPTLEAASTPAQASHAEPAIETAVAPPTAVAPLPEDAIGRLVVYLNSTHGLWQNGMSPTITLPADAPAEAVVTRALRGTDGLTTSHVIEVRHVDIEGNDIRDTAVLVDTNVGQRIVLLGYNASLGWDTKVFDTSH